MRWLVIITLMLGGLVGVAWPMITSATPSYSVYMFPPSGLDGNSSRLNCGWHGTCSYGDGPGQDWPPVTETGVFFRITALRGSAPYETSRLLGRAKPGYQGPLACDDMAVDVMEVARNNQVMFGMHYLHSYRNDQSDFVIPTSSGGAWSSRRVAWMSPSDNDPNCFWTGQHTHDYGIYFVAAYGNRSTYYEVDNYCNFGTGNCHSYINNGSGSFTQWASWTSIN